MFGDRRWIDVGCSPKLRKYTSDWVFSLTTAPPALIGARKKDVEDELGIDIDEEKRISKNRRTLQKLKIR